MTLTRNAPPRTGVLVLGLALGLAAMLALCAAAGAQQPQEKRTSPWWSWWTWADGLFGLTIGGVTYGDDAKPIIGSERLVNESRPVPGVRGIEIRGPVDVVLRQGPAERLSLHTDDNIAPLIETVVQDGILRIGVKAGSSFHVAHAIGATIEIPQLQSLRLLASGDLSCAQFEADLVEITVGGSGGVRIDSLRAGTVAVLVQGSGDVHLSGVAARQGYVIEGSGDIGAEELAGSEVAVRIAGSGNAQVWANKSLAVDISGSGDVIYRGQAALTSTLHGSGQLRHR